MAHELYIANCHNQIPINLRYTDRSQYNTHTSLILGDIKQFSPISSAPGILQNIYITANTIRSTCVKDNISFIMLAQRMTRVRYLGREDPWVVFKMLLIQAVAVFIWNQWCAAAMALHKPFPRGQATLRKFPPSLTSQMSLKPTPIVR